MSRSRSHAHRVATIGVLRRRIDTINLKLLRLVEVRARTAVRIGRLKSQCNLELIDTKRERHMMQTIVAAQAGFLPSREIKRVFVAIFSASRKAVVRTAKEDARVRK